MSVLEGQSVRLACECHGIPFPTLTWWKDGRVLPLSLIPAHLLTHQRDVGLLGARSALCSAVSRWELVLLGT